MQKRKKKYFLGNVLCLSMVLIASVMVYAAGSGASVGFSFCISTTQAGYSSDPVQKTAAVDAAYAKVTANGGWWIVGNKSTAFIVTDSTGTQLSDEDVLKGTGNATPVYKASSGKNYLGNVCLRANTAEASLSSEYDVKGTFYPNGS